MVGLEIKYYELTEEEAIVERGASVVECERIALVRRGKPPLRKLDKM